MVHPRRGAFPLGSLLLAGEPIHPTESLNAVANWRLELVRSARWQRDTKPTPATETAARGTTETASKETTTKEATATTTIAPTAAGRLNYRITWTREARERERARHLRQHSRPPSIFRATSCQHITSHRIAAHQIGSHWTPAPTRRTGGWCCCVTRLRFTCRSGQHSRTARPETSRWTDRLVPAWCHE